MRWSWPWISPQLGLPDLCTLVVIPLVTHGVSAISALQIWTQPLWLALAGAALRLVLGVQDPPAFTGHRALRWGAGHRQVCSIGTCFGAALTVGIALIAPDGRAG